MINTQTYLLRLGIAFLICLSESHLAVAQSPQGLAPGGSEQKKALVQRWIEEGFNKRDLAVVDQIFLEPATINETLIHRENLKQSMKRWFSAFPDLQVTIDQIICEGDTVGLWYTAHGTHRGEFQGISATGRQVKWVGVDLLRLKDGKIVEARFIDDSLGLLRQVGASVSLPSRPN
jgi:steroid delta-isomerase-like uncharacterized protein